MLLRMQAARQKVEANPETHDRAAWTEHCALNLMAEALSPPPPPATPSPDLTVAMQNVAHEDAAAKAEEPQTEPVARPPSPCGRGQGEGAVPMTRQTPNHATLISPQTDVQTHRVERFAHLPSDDLIKAIFALKPASLARENQPAEAAEA
jgi:hypothetical protein